MATTVTYKGQTLTTVENETKVLETKGTWVEDDFTLTDVTEGGGVVEDAERKAINFYDYDGTRLYSYSAIEWENVTELPPNPSHVGLVAQGWNWTKAEIDEQRGLMPEAPLHIGQLYTTESGALEIDIELYPEHLTPYLCLGVNGSAVIDWGDGTPTDAITGTRVDTRINTLHSYSSPGKYTIKVYLTGTGKLSPGNANNATSRQAVINAGTGTNEGLTRVYSSAIRHIRMADNWSLGFYFVYGAYMIRDISICANFSAKNGNYTFQNCSLKAITLPKSAVQNAGDAQYNSCYFLETLCNPYAQTSDGMTNARAFVNYNWVPMLHNFAGQAFQDCWNLRDVYIGAEQKTLVYRMFQNCTAITNVTIPASITTINQQAFSNCYGLKEVHCKGDTPPTANANIFENLPTDCVIYVPYSSDHSILEAYQTATNWSTYASYMVEEPE